jgi:hypothetical protein
MCRDRAGKWKLAEIMEIRELKAVENDEDDLPIEDPATKRFKTEANPEESKQEADNQDFEMPTDRLPVKDLNVKKDFEAWTFWWISAEHPRFNDGHKYEYYVNYCGIDRYLNRWVPFYFLKKDKDLQ